MPATVAVLTAQTGVELPELEQPLNALRDAGIDVVHIAPKVEPVQTMVNDTDKDKTFDPDRALSDVTADEFDLLLLPGGTVNADQVRADADSVGFITSFIDAGKPVAAICHAPWSLVESGKLPGKTLTSFPSLRTDVVNAGGTWVDEEVFVCPANDWTLITSRNPDDLDAFCAAVIEQVQSTQ